MRLNFIGDIAELEDGINILSYDYGFERADDGRKVFVSKTGNIFIDTSSKDVRIEYGTKADFFRMLSYLLIDNKNTFNIREIKYFDTCGAMLDLSHCALCRTDVIKSIVRKMCLMGLNMLMLYFEESYTVSEYPYFGYMRGRYTKEELMELDDYADKLGIEIIPAIQTIGHLSNTLRWKCFADIKDTDDCLLVGEEKTYEFIENCIKSITSCFKSDRLHIGFDETMSLGTGTYMRNNGYRPRIDIYLEHLQRVSCICDKYDKKPIIWSDMLFRLKGSTSGYALDNSEIPNHVAIRIPKNVELVEANYSLCDIDELVDRFKAHTNIGRKSWFAGAVQDWHGFCVHYKFTLKSSEAALTAAKKTGLKDVFATTWGDDSTERDILADLLGFAFYSEHMYNDIVDINKFKKRFDYIAKVPAEFILDISDIDEPALLETKNESSEIVLDTALGISNPSKYLMWQDPLMGLFDTELSKLDYSSHFRACYDKIKSYKLCGDYYIMQDFYLALCNTLIKKVDLSLNVAKAYSSDDKLSLKIISDSDIPELIQSINDMWQINRKLWFARHKPYGWEVLERRYGCLIMRLKTMAYRLSDYINGNIDIIDELSELRLKVIDKKDPVFFNDYLLTSTAWGR